jgi:hypothetical protein
MLHLSPLIRSQMTYTHVNLPHCDCTHLFSLRIPTLAVLYSTFTHFSQNLTHCVCSQDNAFTANIFRSTFPHIALRIPVLMAAIIAVTVLILLTLQKYFTYLTHS